MTHWPAALGSILRDTIQVTTRIVAHERRARRAIRRMPRPVPWDWARPRLMPILAGPRFDHGSGGPIQVVGGPGCAVLIAIDLGGALPVVDHEVAERWECTVDQLMAEARSNLEQRAARIQPASVGSGSLSGYAFRFLDTPHWCSSLVLVPEHLTRLFGTHDQTIATPATSTIVSLATDVPSRIVAEIVVGVERRQVYPLLLDPFLLEDGQLTWDGASEWEDDDW